MSEGFIYVLICSDGKYYVGSTRNLAERLLAHQRGAVKTTKSRRPVKLILSEQYISYQQARRRELYLKTGAGRDWLKNNLKQ
jgi:predicted GIY-YIG superfamily endonuclease